jgi:hypothetical protein
VVVRGSVGRGEPSDRGCQRVGEKGRHGAHDRGEVVVSEESLTAVPDSASSNMARASAAAARSCHSLMLAATSAALRSIRER